LCVPVCKCKEVQEQDCLKIASHCHSLLDRASRNKLYRNFQSNDIDCYCSCSVLNKIIA